MISVTDAVDPRLEGVAAALPALWRGSISRRRHPCARHGREELGRVRSARDVERVLTRKTFAK